MEFFMADLAFELKKTKEGFYLKTYFLKSLHFGYFKICEPKWVTKMERNGYKNVLFWTASGILRKMREEWRLCVVKWKL